jgi:tetratricopeptide (TPR) repeat protein
VIELFARLKADRAIESLYERGRGLVSQRRYDQAIEVLCRAMLLTHSREELYGPASVLLRDAFAATGNARAALSLSWYVPAQRPQRRLLDQVPPIDRARTLAHWRCAAAIAARSCMRAAHELEEAGLLARAAISTSAPKTSGGARLVAPGAGARHAALDPTPPARFNVARMSRVAGDERRARHGGRRASAGRSRRPLRVDGQRERAFDCYHVLIAIGELDKTLEHVLEGSVNAIRILSEDNLRYHALRLYDHAIRVAEQAGETSAAATIAREMASYARKQGLSRIALRGVLLQANLWQTVAEQTLARGGPAQLAENAYVASLLAAAEAGQYTRVGDTYEKLGELAIDPQRRQAYARSAQRTSALETPARPRAARRAPGRAHSRPTSGTSIDRMGESMATPPKRARTWCSIRRRERPHHAAHGAGGPSGGARRRIRAAAQPANAAVVVANYLAPIGLYTLIAPLEAAFARPEPKCAWQPCAPLALLLQAHVRDPRAGAARPRSLRSREATAALERLRFDHAFDPLAHLPHRSPRRGPPGRPQRSRAST